MDEEQSLRDRYRFAQEQWARVQREAQALREALEFYADVNNWAPREPSRAGL